eukprot:TCONS_00057923-protein
MLFTLRKHWKKSVFAACSITYAFHYGSQRFREYLTRRQYFFAAQGYGEACISPLDKPRRLYVVLNPAASNRKAKKLFQTNAAPLLYLAGIDVTYIQTDYEGHAKTIVNYFDPTIDGIVVVGGNGTIQEVVTGIMRQDEKNPVINIPVGIVPTGEQSNALFKRLFGSDVINVKAMCESAMAIIQGQSSLVDVVEVKTDQKSIFALNSIHVGLHQQVKEKLDDGKYWILGPLKRYFACGWKTIKNWPPIENGISVTCSKCSSISRTTHQEQPNSLLSKAACFTDEELLTQKESVGSNKITTSGLSVWLTELDQRSSFTVQYNADEVSKTEFIQHGAQWIKNKYKHTPADHLKTVICDELSITLNKGQELSYDIDGEIYDGRPIHVSVYPRKLHMFVPKK